MSGVSIYDFYKHRIKIDLKVCEFFYIPVAYWNINTDSYCKIGFGSM